MSHFLILISLLSFNLFAEDLGTFGKTFTILEDDFIQVLKERLENSQISDEKKINLQNEYVKTIKNPKGKIFAKAQKFRSFEYDPTICVGDNIKDHEDKIIIHKGTLINPLEKTPLREPLLFFDGNDFQQIAWAKNLQGKWILTNGNPLQLEEEEKHPVYFDQAGYLADKLKIQYLPCRVIQIGSKLQIEEIPCF